MALPDKGLPPDPWKLPDDPELPKFAANCYAMFSALMAAGFRESQALQLTAGIVCGMITMAGSKPQAPQ